MVDPLQEALGNDGDDVPDTAGLVTQIRGHTGEDTHVQQLLALYDRGFVLRRDVIRSGMTEWTYRAARQRLARYAEMAISAADASAAAS